MIFCGDVARISSSSWVFHHLSVKRMNLFCSSCECKVHALLSEQGCQMLELKDPTSGCCLLGEEQKGLFLQLSVTNTLFCCQTTSNALGTENECPSNIYQLSIHLTFTVIWRTCYASFKIIFKLYAIYPYCSF